MIRFGLLNELSEFWLFVGLFCCVLVCLVVIFFLWWYCCVFLIFCGVVVVKLY